MEKPGSPAAARSEPPVAAAAAPVVEPAVAAAEEPAVPVDVVERERTARHAAESEAKLAVFLGQAAGLLGEMGEKKGALADARSGHVRNVEAADARQRAGEEELQAQRAQSVAAANEQLQAGEEELRAEGARSIAAANDQMHVGEEELVAAVDTWTATYTDWVGSINAELTSLKARYMRDIEEAQRELQARENALEIREAQYTRLQGDAERLAAAQPDMVKIDVGGTVFRTTQATVRAEDGSWLDGMSRRQNEILEAGGRGGDCRRRDCHSAAPPSPFSRRFNVDGEGGVSKMTVSPTARRGRRDIRRPGRCAFRACLELPAAQARRRCREHDRHAGQKRREGADRSCLVRRPRTSHEPPNYLRVF